MIEFERTGLIVPEGAEEQIKRRLPNAKLFVLPDGKHNIKCSLGLLHYNLNNSNYDDIDLEPEDKNTHWLITKAPYTLEIAKDRMEYIYRSKQNDLEINVSLQQIDGGDYSISAESTPHKKGHAIECKGLLGDGDLSLVIRAEQVHTEQVINSVDGVRTLKWKVTQNRPDPIVVETFRAGRDSEGNKLKIDIERTALRQTGKLWEHEFEERFTGEALEVADPKTRIMRSVAAQYPVTFKS